MKYIFSFAKLYHEFAHKEETLQTYIPGANPQPHVNDIYQKLEQKPFINLNTRTYISCVGN